MWEGVEVLLHEALDPLQVELDQHVVELGALVLPHVDDVLQIRDGQLLEALRQEVQRLVPGQVLHLDQVLGEDLGQRRTPLAWEPGEAFPRSRGAPPAFTFRPSSGQIFSTQGENSKMIPRFSAPAFAAQTNATISPPDALKTFAGGGSRPHLTQSLQILHGPLVALQGGVGLLGLVQEHLQSCAPERETEKS